MIYCPKGLEDLAQGFNPGNHPISRCALKGRRRTRSIPPDLAPPNRDQSIVDVQAETGGEEIVFLTLLGQSMWRPFRARRRGGRFLGLKPQAESYSPFGAPEPRSNPENQRVKAQNATNSILLSQLPAR